VTHYTQSVNLCIVCQLAVGTQRPICRQSCTYPHGMVGISCYHKTQARRRIFVAHALRARPLLAALVAEDSPLVQFGVAEDLFDEVIASTGDDLHGKVGLLSDQAEEYTNFAQHPPGDIHAK